MTTTAPPSATPRRPLPVAIPAAIALAWAVIIAAFASGHADAIDHDALLGEGRPPTAAAVVAYAAAWIAMVAAMMLPSAVPLVRLFTGASANQPRPGLVLTIFVGGYLAVWTAFGWLALGLDGAVHAIVDTVPWLDTRPWLVAAAVLAMAGGFQFSSLKERCLRTCRHPAAYLLARYRRGGPAAFRLGWGHGLFCLGCCWALMLVAFAAGAIDLRLMAAFTALMTYEKIGRHGETVARAAGIVLLTLAAVVAAHPVSGAITALVFA
jgi:predicted metal-binding membrane protein